MAVPLIKFKPKRQWMQVSLRTMFAAVALLCVILSLWVVPAERQRRTVAAIHDMGGAVDYVPFLSLIEDSGVSDPRESEAFPKTFLRRWLPPDYFDEVLIVLLQNMRLTDAKLAHLQGLTSLESLALGTDPGITAIFDRSGKATSGRSFRLLQVPALKPSCSLSPSFDARTKGCFPSRWALPIRRMPSRAHQTLVPACREAYLQSTEIHPLLQPWSWAFAPDVECAVRTVVREAPCRLCRAPPL